MPPLLVNELFVSIQGETSWSGYPCCFVRLAGCNLRCRWCDTQRAQTDEGQACTIDAIVQACRKHATPLIAITGGEPLRQPEFTDLANALLTLPAQAILVETNGSYDIGRIPPGAIAIMDIKCPGSGESAAMDWRNLDRLRPHDEIKFVLSDRTDYAYALDILQTHHLAERCRHVHFTPAAGRLEAAVLAGWMIADRPAARLQLQIHRYLNVP